MSLMSGKEKNKEDLLDRLGNVFGKSYLRSVDISLSDQRLQKVLWQHRQWLETEGREGERANLRGADLYQVDLREANLSGANLSQADLREANLWAANFSEANLSGADLGAEYRVDRDSDGLATVSLKERVNLSGADLRGADLHGVDLREANLSRANFSRANLSGASFSSLSVTNFRSLYWAGLSGAYLLPIRVHLSAGNTSLEAQIESAVKSLAEAFGFDIKDFPPQEGPWFKRFYLKINQATKREDIGERLEKMKQAIELARLHQTQANIDKTQAEAVANLLKGLEAVPEGTCQIGPILVVKHDRKVAPERSLTQKEMILLEQNPDLLRNPAGILQALSNP
jgi:uncharacterized protein YjbI with pentapeptide repeats